MKLANLLFLKKKHREKSQGQVGRMRNLLHQEKQSARPLATKTSTFLLRT